MLVLLCILKGNCCEYSTITYRSQEIYENIYQLSIRSVFLLRFVMLIERDSYFILVVFLNKEYITGVFYVMFIHLFC